MDKFCRHGRHIKFCPECANDWAADQAPHLLTNSMNPPRDTLVGVAKDQLGIVSIKCERHHSSLSRIDSKVQVVHINGNPSRWLLEYIIQNGPNVKEIQLQPNAARKLSDPYRRRCREAGIKLIVGLIEPEMAWKPEETRRTSRYIACKKFFELLQGEQRRLFDELLDFGFEAALMAQEYYMENDRAVSGEESGQDNEEPVFLHTLCEKYGYSQSLSLIAYVGDKIRSVMHYLDPAFKVSIRAAQMTTTMRDRVMRLRKKFNNENARLEAAHSLGLSVLPSGMPIAFVEELELVIEAKRKGWLSDLEKANTRRYRAITLRFDIRDPENPRFRTLEETAVAAVGEEYRTRERARQLIEEAFEYLLMRKRASGEKSTGGKIEQRAERTLIKAKKRAAKRGPVTVLTKVFGPLEKQVMAFVCQSYDIDEKTLRSDTRKQPNAEAGQVVMYLWRKYLNWSYPFIAQEIGKQDHTTIVNACEAIAKQRKKDRVLEQRLTLIEMMLDKPPPPLSDPSLPPDPTDSQ